MLLSLLAAGCDETLRDTTGPTPNLEPTFSSIQRNIFESGDSAGRVACVSCHNPANAIVAGNLDLVGPGAYARLVNVPSSGKPGAVRVIPGDADNSYLVRKLEGAADIAGERMPLNGPYLTSAQIDVIRRWIAMGARND